MKPLHSSHLFIRLGRLSALLLAGLLSEPAKADEYRLYRIVGPDLEFYSRVECKFGNDVDSSEAQIALLREAGLYDVRPEDMADDACRPQTRGDGLVWDAPRSRWMGFVGHVGTTLVALSQDDAERTLVPLYEFESVPSSFPSLWPSDDPNVFFAAFLDNQSGELPLIVRIEFDETQPPAVEEWDMSKLDSEQPIDDTPWRTQWTSVSQDRHVFAMSDHVTMWEFGEPAPMRVFSRDDEHSLYSQMTVSPDGELVAAIDMWDCTLNVWRVTEEAPLLSLSVYGFARLGGGLVKFTPDGQYLWFDPIFPGELRVWRCADWVEMGAYRVDDRWLAGISPYNSAEWIVLHRDRPFEDEPTDWFERRP